MQKTFLFILLFAFGQTIWTQRSPDRLSAEEQRLSDELRKDQEYLNIDCGRRPAGAHTDRDTSYRLKAHEAFNKGNEKSKLKKSCGTKEGDPIFSYLMVERGKATLFVDTSQDDFGRKRVYSYQCSEVDIGVYFNDLNLGKMIFEKNETDEIKGRRVALRCVAGMKEIIF
jgi:hypothetical protein